MDGLKLQVLIEQNREVSGGETNEGWCLETKQSTTELVLLL